jgi:hypothetical protein
MKSESEVVREICDWLHNNEYFFWRSNNIPAPGRAMPKYTPRGLPDVFVVVEGIMVGVEAKREGSDTEREKNGRKVRVGKLSGEQADFGTALILNGSKYIVVHSLNEFVNAFLHAIAR